MRVITEIEILGIKEAQPYDGKPAEHKTELMFKNVRATKYGDETTYKKAKSLIETDKFKLGKAVYELEITPYIPEGTKRAELSIKLLRQVK